MNEVSSVPWPERWMKKRFGFFLLFALAIWPFVGLVPQIESIVVNGLLLDTYWQLAYLTITNVVTFFFAISILRVLGSRNPGGKLSRYLVSDSEAPWGRNRVVFITLAAMFAPMFMALVFGSEFSGTNSEHFWRSVLTVCLSSGSGVAG